jgi:hypothetical protein
MKSKSYKEIKSRSKKFVLYRISDHAMLRVRERFPHIKLEKDLEYQLSIMILNAKKVRSTQFTNEYLYGKIRIVTIADEPLIKTIIDTTIPKDEL